MASMAVYLRSRPRSLLQASARVHSSSSRSHFSSSSSPPPDPKHENAQPSENNQSNSTSSWGDVRSRLQGRDWQPSQQPPRQGFSISQGGRPLRNKPTSPVDMSEIRKNLSQFNLRAGAPSSSRPLGVHDSQVQQPSFQDIYRKRSQIDANRVGLTDKGSSPREAAFNSIRQHLETKAPYSMSNLKDSLNLKKPDEGSRSAGSRVMGVVSEGLPEAVFGKEKKESEKVDPNALVRSYSVDDLGERLRQLRPDGAKKGKDQFSLSELNERLVKLRELDLQHQENSPSLSQFDRLKETLVQVQNKDSNKQINSQSLGLLGQLGGTPAYMVSPPKEHLVEKYFHPDNMSSAEKLKLELKAVRDEFKMSETDCGSTRVQIAQLTTEISHLSKVLHKKDKHSKKGLLAKVQLRKKLLKYLRRTDWDSYCFILSKLGLRDNPGYKHL